MKQKLLLLAMGLFAAIGTMKAENVYYTVDKVDVMQGKTAKVTMCYDADGSHVLKMWEVHFILPDGLTIVGTLVLGAEVAASCPAMDIEFTPLKEATGETIFLGIQMKLDPMPTGEGIELFSFYVKADENMELGEYPVETTKIEFASDDKINIDPQTITYNIIEPVARILQDTDPDLPEASILPEDVIVRRTIKGDTWSTICLPFAMTKDQLVEAFGENVFLAEFKSTEVDGDVLKVNFERTDLEEGLEANHPYCIYSGNALSEFEVKNVLVSPDEEAAQLFVDNGKSGRQKVEYGYFHGTLKYSETYLPEEDGDCLLYLLDNKFYYNEQSIWMNAFRGYFELYDFTPEFGESIIGEDGSQAVNNAIFTIDGEATAIEGMNFKVITTGDVYNVNGMYMGRAEDVMSTLPRGIYVINNKKVVVK
jgi:hypothetical protein